MLQNQRGQDGSCEEITLRLRFGFHSLWNTCEFEGERSNHFVNLKKKLLVHICCRWHWSYEEITSRRDDGRVSYLHCTTSATTVTHVLCVAPTRWWHRDEVYAIFVRVDLWQFYAGYLYLENYLIARLSDYCERKKSPKIGFLDSCRPFCLILDRGDGPDPPCTSTSRW